MLSEALREWSFGRVLVSPLSRAVETCELAGLDEGRRSARRCSSGTTASTRASRPRKSATRRAGWYLWRDGCPGGETATDVGARVDPLVTQLKEAEGDVALFAHGHLLRVLSARWLGLPPEDGALFALSTATLSALGFERETAVIRRWNAPVRAEGPATAPSGSPAAAS